jgi:CBS domain-containing protein
MNAYDVCQRNVVTVRRHEDLATAAWLMRERNVACLVVVDTAGILGGWRPVGLLSDRDIVTNVVARDCDPRTVVVGDAMAPNPDTVSAGSSLDEAIERLRSTGSRRLPVVDDRGRLVGILTLDDLFEHLARRAAQPVTPLFPEAGRSERRAQPGRMGNERI